MHDDQSPEKEGAEYGDRDSDSLLLAGGLTEESK